MWSVTPSSRSRAVGAPRADRYVTERLVARVLALALVISPIACVPALLSGCGGEEPGAAAGRFATADALVEHYGTLTTGRDRVNWAGIRALVRAETPEQETLMAAVDDLVGLLEVEWQAWERFGRGALPGADRPFQPDRVAARIVERSDRRAVAEAIDYAGEAESIQLVELEGSWWISAYTFEHDLIESGLAGDGATDAWIELAPAWRLAANKMREILAVPSATHGDVVTAFRLGMNEAAMMNAGLASVD